MTIVAQQRYQLAAPRVTRRQLGTYLVCKRLVDITVSAVAIVALLPLIALIALVIRLDDGGPVLFRQRRVGHGETVFTMYKFRTMHVDAEKMLPLVVSERPVDDPEGQLKLFKMKEDPRITRCGKFLRKSSLDELPQLFNILLGNMSLIGPRPPLPREVAEYHPHELKKLAVKPGLTGLWQVMGRSNLPWEQAVRLDLFYVDNRNVLMDTFIFFRTFKVVLTREGAY